MYNVFIEYNEKIAEFQVVLTILAIFAEIVLGFILFTGIVAAIFGEPVEVPAAVEKPEQALDILIAPQPMKQQQIPASTTTIVNLEPLAPTSPIKAKPGTVSELRKQAQTLGIKGAARMKKVELLMVLAGQTHQNQEHMTFSK